MAVINKSSFAVQNDRTRKEKGPLVKVELQPGRFVKMYRQDAIDKGLLAAPETKSQPPAENKMLPPADNKAATPPAPPAPIEPDDFATIQGVGKATARALAAHGIATFPQLKAAGELAYLTAAANKAIEDWRNG